ncbi:MAG: HNH endonuclease [Verrucomicrobia bacterium]|nr:HNH endonuclease [Verrucomicrobiota bacterium]
MLEPTQNVEAAHLLPHARGGTNDLENIVITCAPCNYARMNHTLEEVGLIDPRTREPIKSTWDGLERFR